MHAEMRISILAAVNLFGLFVLTLILYTSEFLDPLLSHVCTWFLAADQVCMGAVSGCVGGVLVGAPLRAVLCL